MVVNEDYTVCCEMNDPNDPLNSSSSEACDVKTKVLTGENDGETRFDSDLNQCIRVLEIVSYYDVDGDDEFQ